MSGKNQGKVREFEGDDKWQPWNLYMFVLGKQVNRNFSLVLNQMEQVGQVGRSISTALHS